MYKHTQSRANRCDAAARGAKREMIALRPDLMAFGGRSCARAVVGVLHWSAAEPRAYDAVYISIFSVRLWSRFPSSSVRIMIMMMAIVFYYVFMFVFVVGASVYGVCVEMRIRRDRR